MKPVRLLWKVIKLKIFLQAPNSINKWYVPHFQLQSNYNPTFISMATIKKTENNKCW